VRRILGAFDDESSSWDIGVTTAQQHKRLLEQLAERRYSKPALFADLADSLVADVAPGVDDG
jgi:hypothetical protein